VNKKWPSDLRDGCKLHSNLAKLIQTYLGFEEELKKKLKVRLKERK
jgi:hypothetical protein